MSPRSRLGAEMWCLGLSSSLLKAGRPIWFTLPPAVILLPPSGSKEGPQMATHLKSPEHTESGGYAGESHRVGGLLCSSGVSHLPLESFAQPCLGPGSSLPK